jgi:hypothetical protein
MVKHLARNCGVVWNGLGLCASVLVACRCAVPATSGLSLLASTAPASMQLWVRAIS